MRKNHQQDQTVTVTCSDNGKTNIAEVVSYNPGQKLVVSLNKTIRLEMRYNPTNKMYIANQTGLEFVSNGPKITIMPGVNRR